VFTFLGFTFRAPSRADDTRKRCSSRFQPAISKDAQNKISGTDPPMAAAPQDRLHPSPRIARQINPVVRGWMQYYGAFYRSALHPLLSRINAYVMRWIRNKYKRPAPHQESHGVLAAHHPPASPALSPTGHGCAVPGGQDDKSPVTRLCPSTGLCRVDIAECMSGLVNGLGWCRSFGIIRASVGSILLLSGQGCLGGGGRDHEQAVTSACSSSWPVGGLCGQLS